MKQMQAYLDVRWPSELWSVLRDTGYLFPQLKEAQAFINRL